MNMHLDNGIIALDLGFCAVRTHWNYRKSNGGELVELAAWAGDIAPSLCAHFHDEAQIVFVLSGARYFSIGKATLVVRAGECIYIPPGLPHRGLPNPHPETACINAYVSTSDAPTAPLVLPMQQHWLSAGAVGLDDVLRAIRTHATGMPEQRRQPSPSIQQQLATDSAARIGDVARDHGYSREGFTRQFRRRVGMSPHAFRIVERLNLARRLLRDGASIADVAAEAGFADQSHLGRLFRKTFGSTPGAYSTK